MENTLKVLMEKIDDLEKFKAEYVLKFQELEKQVKDLRDGSLGTGVYFEGCPDFAVDYIKENKTKDGE